MLQRKGYVEIYTGKGKGKTTAALGVALRTLLAGGTVYFAEFIKGRKTAELALCDVFPAMTMVQFGDGEFLGPIISDEERKNAQEGLKKSLSAATSGNYDLVVLDEIFVAITYHLLTTEDVLDLIRKKNEYTEIILTGRNASEDLIQEADLVTNMQNIKHYFSKGVRAREGIEY